LKEESDVLRGLSIVNERIKIFEAASRHQLSTTVLTCVAEKELVVAGTGAGPKLFPSLAEAGGDFEGFSKV
jgi:hypothetical protein